MKPPSATITLASAQLGYCAPQGPRVTFRLTESEAKKCGLLDRWRSAMQRRKVRQEKKEQSKGVAFLTLNSVLQKLLAKAEQEEWSQRKLAEKIGVPESTLRLIKSNRVNPKVWLPKMEAAVRRLM